MCVAPCQGCAVCHTTLEEHPGNHTTPETHQWVEDERNGDSYCFRCLVKKED